jgi:hypothetical protein
VKTNRKKKGKKESRGIKMEISWPSVKLFGGTFKFAAVVIEKFMK